MKYPRVRIVYPTDPLGTSMGGIDSFVRGLLRYAPEAADVSLVGITTDASARPVRQWSRCCVGDRLFQFFPLLDLGTDGAKRRLPVAASFTFALAVNGPANDADITEFHRIEPVLSGYGRRSIRTAVMHQNMADLRNTGSDIRWRHAPWAYDLAERLAVSRLDAVMSVREDGLERLAGLYPRLADTVRFIPTWADPSMFKSASATQRHEARMAVLEQFDWSEADPLLVSIGRLDSQKDPVRLLEVFARLSESHAGARLLFVGDGVLREQVEARARELQIASSVAITGIVPSSDVSNLLGAADIFALASVYEGMPVSVMEALASGVPVVATPVGEIPRVVKNGLNGFLAEDRSVDAIHAAMGFALGAQGSFDRSVIQESVAQFRPESIVGNLYEFYRELHAAERQSDTAIVDGG